MKMLSICFVGLCLLLTSCSTEYETYDISHFDIQPDALHNGTPVEVLSFSGIPDLNQDLNYYAHAIMVSVETNDTFNLLIVKPGRQLMANKGKNLNYISESSSFYESIISNLGGDTNRLHQVIVHKDFVQDVENEYPTVIGMLGKVEKN